jgi:hypothetical protein
MFPFCLVVVVDALRSGRALSKRAGTTPSDALHINVQINDNISPKIRPPKKIGPNDKIVRTVRMLALATVSHDRFRQFVAVFEPKYKQNCTTFSKHPMYKYVIELPQQERKRLYDLAHLIFVNLESMAQASAAAEEALELLTPALANAMYEGA